MCRDIYVCLIVAVSLRAQLTCAAGVFGYRRDARSKRSRSE